MGVLWPQLSKVLKFVRCVPAEAGCLFAVAAGVHLRGEPTLFPGWCTNKSYGIATSDL